MRSASSWPMVFLVALVVAIASCVWDTHGSGEPSVGDELGPVEALTTAQAQDMFTQWAASHRIAPPDQAPVAFDECEPTAEICNGIDDDCDPTTADGADDPRLQRACDGPDADRCREGRLVCDGGRLRCTDETDDSREECNAVDDDCNGYIDDSAGCPCPVVYFVHATYLFCPRDRWAAARSTCEAVGYHLASIESDVENTALSMVAARMFEEESWWIGLHDRDDEGDFRWIHGNRVPEFFKWALRQPDDGWSGRAERRGEDCVEQTQGTGGRWNDGDCDRRLPFICEND
jgi:hypothetical protein